jgi:hypothetical protein
MSHLKAGVKCHHGPFAFVEWAMEQGAPERDFDKDAKGSSTRSTLIRFGRPSGLRCGGN